VKRSGMHFLLDYSGARGSMPRARAGRSKEPAEKTSGTLFTSWMTVHASSSHRRWVGKAEFTSKEPIASPQPGEVQGRVAPHDAVPET
jgi:hypothetical protein